MEEGSVLRVKKKALGIEDVGKLMQRVEMENDTYTAIELPRRGIDDDGAGLLIGIMLRCRRLQRLCLGGNQIGGVGASCIAETLHALPVALSVLDLSNNKLDPTSCRAIAEAFFKRAAAAADKGPMTRTLNLSDNQLMDKGVLAVGQVLDTFREHRLSVNLLLRNVGCSNRGFMGLVHASASVVGLHVAHNSITPTSVGAYCRVLNEQRQLAEAARVRELDLSYLQPVDPDGSGVIEAGTQRIHLLKTMLRDASTLRKFMFSGNNLGDEGTQMLAQGLIENKQHPLEHLALSNNDIGLNGIAALVDASREAVEASKGLRILELGFNHLNDTCALLLAEMLAWSPRLARLLLSRNCVGEEGGIGLASGIERQLAAASDSNASSGWPCALVELDLNFNSGIQDNAAVALANAALKAGVQLPNAAVGESGESPGSASDTGATAGPASGQVLFRMQGEVWQGPWGLEKLRLQGTGVKELGCEHLANAVQSRQALLLAACEMLEAGESTSSWCSCSAWVPSGLEVYGLELPSRGNDLGRMSRRQTMAELRKLWPGHQTTRDTMRQHLLWAEDRVHHDDSDSEVENDLLGPEMTIEDVKPEVFMSHLPSQEDSDTTLTEAPQLQQLREQVSNEKRKSHGSALLQSPIKLLGNLWGANEQDPMEESEIQEEATEPDLVGDWFNDDCDSQPHMIQGKSLLGT